MTEETAAETPLRPLSPIQKLAIALGSVAMGAGMTINFVVVAPLAREAGLQEIEVAAILTLSTLIYTFVIPTWGRLADRFGRKRVMVFSLLAMSSTNALFLFGLKAALSGVVTGLSALATLAFLRIFFGLLSPGLQPASMAAMTDASTSADRAATLGMLGAAMSLGSILGPAGAAVLAPFGALAPLWGSIALCAATGLLIGYMLPKSKGGRSSQRPTPLRFRDPRVAPHVLFLVSYFVCIGLVQQTLGWTILDRYDLSKAAGVQATGMVFAMSAIGMVATQFGIMQTFKPDPRKMLPLGLGLVSLGYLAAELAEPFWMLCGAFLINGIGAALAVPSANALGSLSVARHEQAAAAALLSAAPPAGFIFGPLIGAGLYMVNPVLPMAAGAVFIGCLALYALFVSGRRPLAQPSA